VELLGHDQHRNCAGAYVIAPISIPHATVSMIVQDRQSDCAGAYVIAPISIPHAALELMAADQPSKRGAGADGRRSAIQTRRWR